MQEIRYDDLGHRDDRVTSRVTMEQIVTALKDEATRKVVLHKPGEYFTVHAHGVAQRYFVLPDGTCESRPSRSELRQLLRDSMDANDQP
jgi:asparagine synthetase B (glutamine-hydrolysing)